MTTPPGVGNRIEPAQDATSVVQPNSAVLIMVVGRRLRERAEERLRERALSMRHLAALGHLSRDPGCSYSELARRSGITAQSMQATLRQLEERGAVERRTPGGRGRTAQLHVTPLGAELDDWAQSVLRVLEEDIVAPMSQAQREALNSTLTSILRSEARP